jgi:hypothetical protein
MISDRPHDATSVFGAIDRACQRQGLPGSPLQRQLAAHARLSLAGRSLGGPQPRGSVGHTRQRIPNGASRPVRFAVERHRA